MLKMVRGRYKNGTVELFEKPSISESDVIITFINPEDPGNIDLPARGINQEEARNLRNRLLAFEDDWNAEGMELYDKL
ncbi:MAG: hypothetical protein AB1585_19345 [Thermodesulfobacteriota bacterium]